MPLLNKKLVDQILILEIDDPESRNAFSLSMAQELESLLDSEAYKAILVTNKGPAFCAGGNLSFYQKLKTPQEGLAVNSEIRKILDKLWQLPVPKVAVVNGSCFGGGVELLSCFDWVIASPQSLFGLWQRRIGLTYGWGGEPRLQSRLSKNQMRELLLSAKTFTSYDAKSYGLVDQIALFDQAIVNGEQWIRKVLAHGESNMNVIMCEKDQQNSAFEKLWMADEHRTVLERFK